MKNQDRYKTAKERDEEFVKWCRANYNADLCFGAVREHNCTKCAFRWLELEAEEEKPLPCPFCGGECECEDVTYHTPIDNVAYAVYCQRENCMYQGKMYPQYSRAIAAHNRVARKCMEVKE